MVAASRVLGRLREEARRGRRLVHALDEEPALGHHVDVSAQRAVHEGQPDAGGDLLHRDVVGEVRPDAPVLLLEDVVVDPAAARGPAATGGSGSRRSDRPARAPGPISWIAGSNGSRCSSVEADDHGVERSADANGSASAAATHVLDASPTLRAAARAARPSGRHRRPRRRSPPRPPRRADLRRTRRRARASRRRGTRRRAGGSAPRTRDQHRR